MPTLNDIMDIDHVIRVNADGTIDDNVSDIQAPEVYVDTDHSGQILAAHEKAMIETARREGWELLTGWTGQYMAGSSPIMHPSEFVAGGLEEHIRETPGYYVVVSVETLDDDEEAAGWAIAFHEVVSHYGMSRSACNEFDARDECVIDIPSVTCSACITAVHKPVDMPAHPGTTVHPNGMREWPGDIITNF